MISLKQKTRIFKAIISVMAVYCGSKYHSQIHIPIEFPNMTALNVQRVPTFFYFSEGRKHDAGMLRQSGLLPMLQHNAIFPKDLPLCVYGGPAYPLRVPFQAPFRQGVRFTPQMCAHNTCMSEVRFTPQMCAHNKCMSEVRVSVEWLFGDNANYVKFLDLEKKLKIELSIYIESA